MVKKEDMLIRMIATFIIGIIIGVIALSLIQPSPNSLGEFGNAICESQGGSLGSVSTFFEPTRVDVTKTNVLYNCNVEIDSGLNFDN